MPINTGLRSNETVYSLLINAKGQTLAGTLYGVFRFINTIDFWTPLNVAPTSRALALAINSSGHLYVSTFSIFRSIDEGNIWEASSVGLTSNLVIFSLAINASGHIFAGSIDGIFRSVNNGRSWQASYPKAYTTSVHVMGENGQILAGTAGGILQSTDNGDHWKYVHLNDDIQVISFASNSRGHIFAGTHQYNAGIAQIFRSTDAGVHWTPRKISSTDFLEIYSLAINANGHIFAGADKNIFRSMDNGATWTSIANTPAEVHSIVINSKGHLFAGTLGVLRSIDNGNSWTSVDEGLLGIGFRVSTLVINANGCIFAGSDGGIFRSIQTTTSIEAIASNDRPISFTLEQNYPNPFNPATKIKFSLSRTNYVTLKIYNTLGEEVETLLSESRAAGKHQIIWQPQDLPSGVYLYRLQANGWTETRKLLFVK